MATLRENIFTACTGNAPLTALIGTRCYPIRLPEGVTLPALTYTQVSEDDNAARSHGDQAERAVARMSFDVWAETADDAAETADALVALWTGYTNGPDIGWAQIVLRQDRWETSLNRVRTIVDVQIEYAR